ncbi:MAG: hypothetical protein K2K05_08235, partial [Muribaculaceae bacterium]|nr:hypothetical protein [Muribaculaceae bacterium]
MAVAKDETRDGVRKVALETRFDNGATGAVRNSLGLPLSFIESENRAFDVAEGSFNVTGVIVDADGTVWAQLSDGRKVAVNDLPADMAGKLGIKVTGEHREERLTDAEVADYENHFNSRLEDYVNNGWRKRDTVRQIRKDAKDLEEVYLAAGFEPEEAHARATGLARGLIEKLTPRKVGGFTIYIENERGSVRSGVDEDNNVWETEMRNDYGFIADAKGTDGDNIDAFLSSDIDGWNGRKVFVVDQYNPDGSFDEHKMMLGFNDRDEAFAAYLSNYEKGWEKGRRLDCTEVNLEDFEKWIESSHRKTKAFADYRSVKALTEEVDQKRTNINKDGIVTDGEGKPLTLYHGTPNKEVTSVSMLEPGHKRMGVDAPARYNGDGVSFSPELSVAQDYAAEAGHGKGRIFPANIRLSNPYYTLGVANFTPEESAEFTASLKAKGYDGIINYSSASMREAGALPAEVVVFDKSAIIPVEDIARGEAWSQEQIGGKTPAPGDKLAGAENGDTGADVEGKEWSIWSENPFLSETEYIDHEVEKAYSSRADANVSREDWEDTEDYIEAFNAASDGYGDYIKELGKNGILQRLYDDGNVGQRIKMRKGIVDAAGFALEDYVDTSKEKEENRLRREAKNKRKQEERRKKLGEIFHSGSDHPETNPAVYEAAKGLVEAAGIEVVEVDEAASQAMLRGHEKTPVAGQPNRANEKLTSGSVLLSISGNSASNRAASKEADAKLRNRTQSAKRKISQFNNGDFTIDIQDSKKAIQGIGKLFGMDTKGGSR